MERSNQWRTQFVGLPTACAVAYAHITGQTVDSRNGAVLNDVARALSSLVAVYVMDRHSGLPAPLDAGDLIEGTFTRGAHVFMSKSGVERHDLAVQRGDLWSALAILKSTGIRFTPPDDTASE